jgi:hypothetical protein
MADQWHFPWDKKKEGPFSAAQLRELRALGRLGDDASDFNLVTSPAEGCAPAAAVDCEIYLFEEGRTCRNPARYHITDQDKEFGYDIYVCPRHAHVYSQRGLKYHDVKTHKTVRLAA